MKTLLLSLTLIAFISLPAISKASSWPMGFERDWFGKELPGGIFQITKTAQFQKHVAKISSAKTDCEVGAVSVSRGRFEKIGWTLFLDTSYCAMDMQRPSLLVVTIPGTQFKYAILGIGHSLKSILFETNPTGTVSWTLIAQSDGPEGSVSTTIHRLFFDDAFGKPRLPTGLRPIHLPEDLN